MRIGGVGLRASVCLIVLIASAAAADYDEDPIRYSTAPVDDPVARLARRLTSGGPALAWDAAHGYLPALLQELGIARSSQVLVFSKTSLQRDRISPQRPRALYFNDEVYVGMVQGSDDLEIASIDPRQGAIFYLGANRQPTVDFQRQTQDCLQCHDSSAFTGGVPGLMMRSVFPDQAGRPILPAGTRVTDQASPIPTRWGGWYVTGTTGTLGHLGNRWFTPDVNPETVDPVVGANRTSLAGLVDTTPYLAPGSDVVALLVLGHQLSLHNLLTRASYEGRRALRSNEVLNEALGRPRAFRSDSYRQRIASVGEEVVRALLCTGEAPLAGPVRGTSTFAADFATRGPRDAQGRSLRDLDLERRLLRYPLSYLIYGESFAALPASVLDYVYPRLLAILTGQATDDPCPHLTAADRRAILEILVATKPGLPSAYALAVAAEPAPGR
jgi:hypothetical protein